MMPDIINISEAKVSDRRGVNDFRYAKETIIVDGSGYFDTKLFSIRIEDENHFVTRIKGNILYEYARLYTTLHLALGCLPSNPYRASFSIF